ncbi:MAG: glycosyltransferase family 4 protein [Candidatus Margulisbacteria bacterium]|nr:glycosyltransferase family 4 protein [Candidatus Margulisiibacteriota bacterium]MBU1022064.1 glycosyltransferase family 4 protein [Candidatus Margulisiibacteriota bacterium]MBU1729659.1 glycosyltransferase family 4 protein [Candidatus Margulisiibacteriota bacterium]MBU1954979.1 glycosyltransferase family 4 protein [Candidatus Margulisiibacteriota bacterium]
MSDKLKVAMVVPYFYPHTGGTEKYVKDLSIALMRAGHTVEVISSNLPAEKNALAEEIMEGFKVIRLPATNMFNYLPVTKKKFDIKMLDDYDIVHCHVPAYGFLREARKSKKPVVVTFHCDITVSEKYYGVPIPGFIVKLFEWAGAEYGRQILKCADVIYNTTKTYADTSPVLKDMKNIRHIPIGIFHDHIDAMQKKLGLTEKDKNPKQILWLGRMAGNKGCDYMVKAMPAILAKHPDTKLVICGDGEEKAFINSLIDKFGIRNSIEMYGMVDFAKLVELFYKSLVYVFPSINRLEAFGIVQLEAMVNNTAVVATDIPGPNAVMDEGKTGYLVPKQDPAAIAEKVNELLSNPQKAIEMGKAGRRLVETKYDWKGIADQVVELYKEALAKKEK